jgi:hypothetical protein
MEWAWVAGESAPEPRSPVASPEKAKEIGMEKTADESRMAKNGNGNLKKKIVRSKP